jgi:hypothetical protein
VTLAWETSNHNRKVAVGGLIFVCHKAACLDCFFVNFEKLTDLLAFGFFGLVFFFPVLFFEVALAAASAELLSGWLVDGLGLCLGLFFMLEILISFYGGGALCRRASGDVQN